MNKKKAILRSPTHFWKSRSKILTSFLDRMCTQTERRACFFFHPSFGQFYIFRIFTPTISLGQKTNIRCLCIIVVSTKSLPKVLHWAGHDQSTSLAVTWQAQLLLPRSTVSYFVDVRATCPCAMLYTCTSRLRLVRPKISNEIDDNEKANTRTQQYEVCRCSPRSRYPRLYPWPLKSAGA